MSDDQEYLPQAKSGGMKAKAKDPNKPKRRQLVVPYLDWDNFQLHYDSVGGDITHLPPDLEVTALVMQAWAARFSDDSSITGSKAAPKDLSPSQLCAIGEGRFLFAEQMKERAQAAIDAYGIYRMPTPAGCAALIMMELLVDFGDAQRSAGRHLLASAAEHLRCLCEAETLVTGEPPCPRKGALSAYSLFWIAWTRDAQSAAMGGRKTVRQFNDMVGSPQGRRLPIDEDTLRRIWKTLQYSAELSAVFRRNFMTAISKHADDKRVPKEDIWSRDLSSLRLQLAYSIHHNLEDRVEREGPEDKSPYAAKLCALLWSSHDQLLDAAREFLQLLRGCGSEVAFFCGIAAEYAPLYASVLLNAEAEEEGEVFENWRIEDKVRELGWSDVARMIDALGYLGWVWNGYGDANTMSGYLVDEGKEKALYSTPEVMEFGYQSGF
ncbi:transcription factor [Pseudohyphozyma bogoriensis]|nr:transcription factor [Pseudohyphozyma bogoriensis]